MAKVHDSKARRSQQAQQLGFPHIGCACARLSRALMHLSHAQQFYAVTQPKRSWQPTLSHLAELMRPEAVISYCSPSSHTEQRLKMLSQP